MSSLYERTRDEYDGGDKMKIDLNSTDCSLLFKALEHLQHNQWFSSEGWVLNRISELKKIMEAGIDNETPNR